MSGVYSLTESEYNGISNAITKGLFRLVACEDLMDLLEDSESFENTLNGLLGSCMSPEPPIEVQKDNAYKWLLKHYELISATFSAVRVLVDDTRDNLEMINLRKTGRI